MTAMKNGFQKIVYIARNTRKRQIKKEKKKRTVGIDRIFELFIKYLFYKYDKTVFDEKTISLRFELEQFVFEQIEVTRVRPESKKSYSNPYESYDKGYEDVYEDGDYDDDRYNSDSDYADGVDDAIDEDEEGDW